jgi:hypothetical protein
MAADEDHGRTPAAWTAVTIALLGFVIGGIGMIAAEPWIVGVGAAVIVLGVIVGKGMQMMGLGRKLVDRD